MLLVLRKALIARRVPWVTRAPLVPVWKPWACSERLNSRAIGPLLRCLGTSTLKLAVARLPAFSASIR